MFPVTIPANPSRLIVICGPCRTGTTALSNVFVRAGIPSHMQPIKSALRAIEIGETPVHWTPEPGTVIMSKETLGPSLSSEFFNPAELLLLLGYPADRLSFVLMVRDPEQVHASWERIWKEVDPEKLAESFELTAQIRDFCRRRGIQCVSYAHELIRDYSSERVVHQLFGRLGLCHDGCQVCWNGSPKFGDQDPGNAHLAFYDQPPDHAIEGVRDWGGYEYRALDIPPGSIPRNHRAQAVYQRFYRDCVRELEL